MKILYSFTMLLFLVLSACGRESGEESQADVDGQWACTIEKQYECTRDGCVPRERPPKIVIDFDKGQFSRCTGLDCDAYPFKIFEDPLLSVWVGKIERARGAYFVVDSDGSNFVESVSQGAWTISSFGSCEAEIVTK